MKNNSPIRYRIRPHDPEAHLFEVSCTISDPATDGQCFALPAWIPGSYLIRDFARHVIGIRAHSGRKPIPIEKTDKDTWRAAPCSGPLTVTIAVYAWDLSVRGAHLDTTHAFFNGTSVFLRPLGAEARPCEVDILRPGGSRYRSWRVATTLARKSAPAYGFGTYVAADYDELIDHPVEMGTFTLATFHAGGVPHDIAITGRHDADMDRLCADLSRLCTWHIDLFGRPAPMKRYLFLVTALGEGYGGLEHRASTALLCARDDLPRKGMQEVSDAYRTFLGLCSHEYFHTWNVKRIKPAAFTPYDLQRENVTTLLWAFEGITSYYDDLALVRSGLIGTQDYLELLGRSITSLLRTGGRLKQTVSESSFDAWIKYYRQDENAPNALVSYYLKGSLIALCLDLQIRERTRGRKSLDDVLRALWQRYGKTGIGVPEDGWERIAEEISGLRLRPFFDRALRSTDELPLKQALASVGVDLHLRQAESATDRGGHPGANFGARSTRTATRRVALGARTTEDGAGVKLTHVLDGGSAQRAGLAAGDVLVALDGLRVNQRTLDKHLQRFTPQEPIRAHAFRRDELIERALHLQPAPIDTCHLTASTDAVRRRRHERWLGDGGKA
ncbi:MAG: M61 family metallopeptidase [Burkholderiales bacterium]|nr:M61 family metallopeptidase [Burkholderiales bacterium]